MASRRELSRNNVRAGVFVTLSLLLLVAVIAVLADFREKLLVSYRPLQVVFPLERGVGQLATGSEVRLGGVLVGQVADVLADLEDDTPRIRVRFQLRTDIPLREGVQIFVGRAIIGSGAWLNISDIGSGEPLPRDAVIEGETSVGLLANLLGPGNSERVVEKTLYTLDNAARFSDFLTGIPAEYETRVAPTLDDVQDMVLDFRTQRWPQWADRVDGILAWANQFTGTVDEAMAEAKVLMTDGREVVAENRPRIERTMGNVEEASGDARQLFERAAGEVSDKAVALLERGDSALVKATEAIEHFQRDYEGWSADVGGALADAALASGQIKLASVEIRRSPWKLLYRPGKEELEHEMLYNATRTFALAAADLESAAEWVSRVLDRHGPGLAEDPRALRKVHDSFMETFDRYQQAQQQLFDVLVTDLE